MSPAGLRVVPGTGDRAIFKDIGVRNWLVTCWGVTENSQRVIWGYGPFQEGAEPTAPIPPRRAPARTAPRPIPARAAPAQAAPPQASAQDAQVAAVSVPALASDGQATVGGVQAAAGNVQAAAEDMRATAEDARATAQEAQATARVAQATARVAQDPPAGANITAGKKQNPANFPGMPVSAQNTNVLTSAQNGETPPTPPAPPTPSAPNAGQRPGRHATPDPSAGPASGIPYDMPTGLNYEDPTTGSSNPNLSTPYGPFHNEAPPAQTWNSPNPTHDPYDFSLSSYPSRRIEPSPPPAPKRLLVGVVAGLVAGLLIFGTSGWFAGRSTAPKPTATATRLGAFERSQLALNRPHFASTGLLSISQGWLPYLSTCSRNGEPGGPKRNAGEKARVRCTLDGMSAIFVEYKSVAERDKARATTLEQSVDARKLTPGVGPATQRPAPSGRTAGNYVEYAYKVTEGGTARPVAGLWWDDAHTPVAAYLLAYWKEGVGQSWEPMRDLWSRYA